MEKKDFHAAGAGTIHAGEYDKISASGAWTLAGEARCTSLSTAGSFRARENIICEQKAEFAGSAHLEKSITTEKLHAGGSLHVDGGVKTEELEVGGLLRVSSIEAEEISVHGKLECAGMVNAERVELRFDEGGNAGFIGGSVIEITQGKTGMGKNLRNLFWGKAASPLNFKVSEGIEGDEIFLEYVTAPTVTGRNVTVGPGCRIGRVQYENYINVSPDAEVGERVKVS